MLQTPRQYTLLLPILRRNFWNTDTQNQHFKWESGKEGEQTMVSIRGRELRLNMTKRLQRRAAGEP